MKRVWGLLFAAALLAGCGRVPVEDGVSRKLAEERASSIDNIHYDLSFRILEDKDAPLEGSETLTFRLRGRGTVQLDFREGAENIRSLKVNGKTADIDWQSEHLLLHQLKKGENRIEIDFIPGDQALNRNDGYMYTLLVPALARTVFPCFDQPDLKAVFSLRLDIPEKWVAVSDGSLRDEIIDNGRNYCLSMRLGPSALICSPSWQESFK